MRRDRDQGTEKATLEAQQRRQEQAERVEHAPFTGAEVVLSIEQPESLAAETGTTPVSDGQPLRDVGFWWAVFGVIGAGALFLIVAGAALALG